MQFSGDYTLALKLLLRISGNGRFKGSFSESHKARDSFSLLHFHFLSNFLDESLAHVVAHGVLKQESERTLFTLKVKLQVSHAHFKMESLPFNDLGNKIINENSKLFLEELIPGLEDSLSRTFSDIVNEILKDSTYDEMFPE